MMGDKEEIMMLDQKLFGQRLRERRKAMGLRQSDVAAGILVTEQAVSKWEKGDSLPDLNNLVLLARLLRVSVDELLDVNCSEQIIDRIQVCGAVIDVVQRPAIILAGKILHAGDYDTYQAFDAAIGDMTGEAEKLVLGQVKAPVLPVRDIHLSVNFWLPEDMRAYGFMRETTSADQPDGIDVYKVPASVFLRAYTDAATANLLVKERCEVWELFAYLRSYVMPAHGFREASNGAQEMEVFDTPSHQTGYAYLPVQYK